MSACAKIARTDIKVGVPCVMAFRCGVGLPQSGKAAIFMPSSDVPATIRTYEASRFGDGVQINGHAQHR